MSIESEEVKPSRKEGSQEKLNEKNKLEKVNDEVKTKGNGWRDILDELDYSNGPGDNIYVFG